METKEPVHVIKAMQLPKGVLINLIYGKDDKFINPEIPIHFWIENKEQYPKTAKYITATHVMDSRLKKPTNLIEKGLEKGVIFKTSIIKEVHNPIIKKEAAPEPKDSKLSLAIGKISSIVKEYINTVKQISHARESKSA